MVTMAAVVVARAARRLQLEAYWSASWRPSAAELLCGFLVLGVVHPVCCSSWAACEGRWRLDASRCMFAEFGREWLDLEPTVGVAPLVRIGRVTAAGLPLPVASNLVGGGTHVVVPS